MRFLLTTALLLPLVYFLLDPLARRSYIFSPVKLQELSQASIAAHPDNTTLMMHHLVDSLQAEYGEKHVGSLKNEWFFNNAGGAMGAMIILHASLTEYMIIFGTPLGTEGHTGVHLADDYFTILAGYQKILFAGDLEATTFKPGDQNYLPRLKGGQYMMNGWALELAQGWIPTMLPFGFWDTFWSTLDVANLWWTIWYTARGIVGQLLLGKI